MSTVTPAQQAPSAQERLCRSCKARVIWAKTSAGKLMPVDARAVKDGNLVLEHVALETPTATKYDAARHGADYPLRYKSHFATCEFAGEHRKPR